MNTEVSVLFYYICFNVTNPKVTFMNLLLVKRENKQVYRCFMKTILNKGLKILN